MKLRTPAVGIVAPAIALTFVIGCASVSAKREGLQLNDQLLAAIRARDTTALMALTATDFEATDYDGKMSREQWCAAVVKSEIVAVDRKKVSVSVDRRGHISICGQHHQRRTGATSFCDDWEKRDGRWQLVSSLPMDIAL